MPQYKKRRRKKMHPNSLANMTGPKTPEGRRKGNSNLIQGEGMTHGSAAFRIHGYVPCNDKCPDWDKFGDNCPRKSASVLGEGKCLVLQDLQEETILMVSELDHIQPEDTLLLEQLAQLRAEAFLIRRYVNRHGLMLYDAAHPEKGIDVQPAMKHLRAIEAQVERVCNDLGLSPKSRAALKEGGTGPSLGSRIANAKRAQTVRDKPEDDSGSELESEPE